MRVSPVMLSVTRPESTRESRMDMHEDAWRTPDWRGPGPEASSSRNSGAMPGRFATQPASGSGAPRDGGGCPLRVAGRMNGISNTGSSTSAESMNITMA